MSRRGLVLFSVACLTACGSGTSLESGSGTGGSGATDAGACDRTGVTFQVTAPSGATTSWCLGQPGSCSSAWLGIRDSSGVLVLANECGTPCDTCTMMGCPNICRVPSELSGQGATQTWNGTHYVAGQCGASATACLSPRCATPGQYTAEICGFPNPAPDGGLGCSTAPSGTQPICVEQPFEYPSSTPIVVTMPT